MFVGFGEQLARDVDVRAIVRLQKRVFDGFGMIFVEKIGKQKAVAERFAHLLSVDFDEPVESSILQTAFP